MAQTLAKLLRDAPWHKESFEVLMHERLPSCSVSGCRSSLTALKPPANLRTPSMLRWPDRRA